MMFSVNFLLLTGVFVAGVPPPQQGPLVYVEQGALRGTYLTSAGGRIFAAFQGIPYARPPTGKHRFKEPVLHKPWRGVWPAIKPGSECLHYENGLHGDEDCLFLNVYSPMLPAGGAPLLDVIVFFHGGAFMFGTAHKYGPKYLLDRDVILVTVNYRLGPLGFLSTEDEVVPGNMGLKDQTVALRWVQRNIAAFGGNPASVTITGLSAGGVSVHYHYFSNASHGLFQRGIAMSGSVLCPWAQMEQGRTKASILAQTLGCNIQTSREIVDCLRHRPASMIVQQVPTFQGWRAQPFSPFGPTVEAAGVNPFLTEQPINALLNGKVQDLPLLLSVTTEEGLYPAAGWVVKEEILNELQNQFFDILPHILDYNYTVTEQQKIAVAESIKQHYFQGQLISSEVIDNIVQMVGDRLFVAEVERAAKLQVAVNSAPIYFYQFGYRGKLSFTNIVSGTNTNFGSSHADDLAYVLDTSYSSTETQQDKDMSRLLVDIWESFAKTGNPTPADSNLIWDPMSANNSGLTYLYIANASHLEMRSNPDLGQIAFWDSLPINEPQISASSQSKTHSPHVEL